MYQEYSRSERLADSVVHGIGLVAGLVAVGAMIVAALVYLQPAATVSLVVYGVGLLAMLGCSAAYNLLPTSELRMKLRPFDQAAIFLMIAATYTPFAAVKIGGMLGFGFIAFVWMVALGGAWLKVSGRETSDTLDIALYLVLGWAGVAIIVPLTEAVGAPVLAMLAIGGLLYSVGVIFHVWRKLKYQNVIWHAFVLAGACCHFGAVNTAMFG